MKKNLVPIAVIVFILLIPITLLGADSLPAEPPQEGENVSGWQTVQGRVISYHFFPPAKMDPGGLTVYYTYSVKDKNYEFETFWYIFDEKAAELIYHDHPKGSTINVRYDPQNPQRSYVIKLNPRVRY